MFKLTGKDTSHDMSLHIHCDTHSLVAEQRWVEGLLGENTEHEAFIAMCSSTKYYSLYGHELLQNLTLFLISKME